MPKDENNSLLQAIQTMFGTQAKTINEGINNSIEKFRLYMDEKLGVLKHKLEALSKENDKLKRRNAALEDRVENLESGSSPKFSDIWKDGPIGKR